MPAPQNGCFLISLNSSSVNRPLLVRTSAPISIFPMSCKKAPILIVFISSTGKPIFSAIQTAYLPTLSEWPKVYLSLAFIILINIFVEFSKSASDWFKSCFNSSKTEKYNSTLFLEKLLALYNASSASLTSSSLVFAFSGYEATPIETVIFPSGCCSRPGNGNDCTAILNFSAICRELVLSVPYNIMVNSSPPYLATMSLGPNSLINN